VHPLFHVQHMSTDAPLPGVGGMTRGRLGVAPGPEALATGFRQADRIRRLQGRMLDGLGLGPVQTPSQVVLAQAGVRLRSYRAPHRTGPPVLVVAAPVKRAYIWDLAPGQSAIRRFLDHGMPVYLAEWTLPGSAEHDLDLAQYADRLLAACLEAVQEATDQTEVVLAGHSLGGTLAAIFAALHPNRVRGLVLIEAPLAFGTGAGAFAPLVAAAPHSSWLRAILGDVPGSFLDVASVVAAPDTFVWARQADLLASGTDPEALATHLRVTRWALDEFPFPGRLFEDVIERLYRQDAFTRGRLTVGGRRVGPDKLTMPMLQVLNPYSRVVPLTSVLPVHEAAPTRNKPLLSYSGERGVALQHVGPLVGRRAHQELWPRILAWIAALGPGQPD
jgi:polyhydroxyalkanoate synthase subunit PhaC